MSEYPDEWTEELREKVREQAAYMCENCGMHQSSCLARYGKKLPVHHKDGDKSNCSLENLAAVCPKCHGGIHESAERIL